MQNISIRRRAIVLGALSALAVVPAHALTKPASDANRGFAQIEKRLGGRLGVAVLDGNGQTRIAYHADQRFPMCSTFKFLAVAAILKRADAHDIDLNRFVPYGEKDLLDYAPICKQHVGEGGLTISALCAAAIQYSDNTAANLLLQALGGPTGLTRYIRSLGDRVTRLDRNEPTLNEARPGDDRDTTSPSAMLGCMKTILLGDALSPSSREQLQVWLIGNTTGAARLRAGLPSTWKIGDKTGSGEHGSLNDIAIAWPSEGHAPLLITAYFVGSKASGDDRNAALAEVGRIVAAEF